MIFPALVLVIAAGPQEQDPSGTQEFPEGGFEISAPGEDWVVEDGQRTDEGYRVIVRRGAPGAGIVLGVLTADVGPEIGAQEARDAAVRSLAARATYIEHDLLAERTIDGLEASGVDVRFGLEGGGEVRSRLWYVVSDGQAWLLSAQGPADRWGETAEALRALAASFGRIERAPADPRLDRIAALAARCGSELAWAANWQEASDRARSEGRHVLVVVRSYRGFDLPDAMRTTTFMDEDLVALLRSEVVPLRLEDGMDAPMREAAVYGMGPSTFGRALLLCDPDGNVLADTPRYRPALVLRWLWSELENHPAPGRRAVPEDALAAALARARRGDRSVLGELRDMAPGLTGEARVRASVVLGRAAILFAEPRIALWCLDWGIAADMEGAVEARCLKASVLVAEGDLAGAREALAPALEREGDPEFPRALHVASALDQLAGGLASARPRRERLVDEFPDSRWAWLAAAVLENEELLAASKRKPRIAWPDPDLLELATEAARAPYEPDDSGAVRPAAVEWLIGARTEDAGWPSLDEIGRSETELPGLITCAVDAIAARTLLPEGEGGRAAAESALSHLLEVDARRRGADEPAVYMDYTAWAAWAQLELVAAALEAGAGEADELRSLGGRLVGDLEARVRKNGGWSYYLSGSADGADAPEQSISFTTAAAIIGLHRARSAGIAVPDELVEGALDCLEAMRSEAGFFAYMLHHPSGVAQHGAPIGAAGRGPACELALFLGGRSSPERLGRSLDLFVLHADGLAGEVGKALMHAGEGAVGCHYPFFDYLMAARATLNLRDEDRSRYALVLEELVLRARLEDGSFQDTPLLGPVFGTAAAIETLRHLRK